MTVDLSRLDDELDRLAADQVSVGRAMLAASRWAGQPLTVIDDALASLGQAASINPSSTAEPAGALAGLLEEDPLDPGGEALEPTPSSSDVDIAATDARVEGADDLAAELGLSSSASPSLSDDDDDAFEIDELEILEDDDLLVID